MGKEFSGGCPKSAVIPLSSWAEESFTVEPVFEWDPGSLDYLSDIIKEKRRKGEDVKAFLIRAVKPLVMDELIAKFQNFLLLTGGSQLKRDQLDWVFEVSLMRGETIGDLAKKHGISKQAFQQGAEEFREAFNIRSQTSRDESARLKMRDRNKRNFKHKGVWEKK